MGGVSGKQKLIYNTPKITPKQLDMLVFTCAVLRWGLARLP